LSADKAESKHEGSVRCRLAVMNEPHRAWRWLAAALEVAVVVALLLVLKHNHTLRQQLAAAAKGTCRKFVVGDEITSVSAISASRKLSVLDLRHGRSVIAIVDPECASCADTIRQAEISPRVQILSLAEPSRTFAALRSTSRTFAIDPRQPLGKLGGGVPQIFAVETGKVVRTCSTISECL
jgi:hypothetical protein